MRIQVNALEARIIGILKDWYPITVEELRDELSLPSRVLERALKSLMVKGVVALEPLTDKTYIRLLSPELVLEKSPKEKKRRGKVSEGGSEDVDSMMYR
jgi:hypothetical protein